MARPIIEVANISKSYTIGMKESYGSLRDEIMQALISPFRRKGRSGSEESRDTFWALKDVSFKVEEGEVLGIIGRNGAGKSTLLKILSRITEPTRGRITMRGRAASLLEVGTGFHPELTGRENIFLNGALLGMTSSEIRSKFDEIVAFSEIEKFLDTPVKRYSSGMYVRLAFAVAAHLEPEILIIDEVLAVGDAEFQKKCLGKMGDVAKGGRTVLFVSHNMGAIERLCTRGIVLNKGFAIQTQNIKEALSLYLEHAKSSEIVFENKVLKKAGITQKEDLIEIYAVYEVDHKIEIPCLGFVISDYMGRPICGANPIIVPPSDFSTPKSAGTIKAVLEYPKLLNGIYRLSLWFGNGKEEYFHAQDCLTFEVVNMAGLKQLPAAAVGAVLPICKWIFT